MKEELWRKHMNRTRFLMRTVVFTLCLLLSVSLFSCSADMDIGNNTELGEQFVSCVIKDDYDSAYDLVKEAVGDAEFKDYWATLQPAVKGASSYEIEQIGWNINTTNGITTRTTAYQVYFDNEESFLLRITTRDDIGGIAGVHFSNISKFLSVTDRVVPTARVILTVISILSYGLVIWMFVDCLRRKIKQKVLWAIVVFFGVTITLTIGESLGLKFFIGLMLQNNTIVADPGIMAVSTKLVFPVGAIVYFFLRKKLTLIPDQPSESVPMDQPAVWDLSEEPTNSPTKDAVEEEKNVDSKE